MDLNNITTMCGWERKKAIYLLGVAEEIGMYNLKDDYGEVAVNSCSGNTYLWNENFPFTLYMPISCELDRNDVYVLWTNPEDGNEIEITLGDHDLDYLYRFCDVMERRYCK